jgi:hypothetical protein
MVSNAELEYITVSNNGHHSHFQGICKKLHRIKRTTTNMIQNGQKQDSNQVILKSMPTTLPLYQPAY